MAANAPEVLETITAGGQLALPPPPAEEEVEQITVNGAQTFKFDKLGPVVVNSDGVGLPPVLCATNAVC